MVGTDLSWMRDQQLYPLDDPGTAFNNALRDVGVNPFRSNPFIDQLSKAANGSRIAFLARGRPMYAASGGSSFSNPSTDYAAYLKDNLSNGTMFQNLQATAQNWGDTINKMKAYEDSQANGSVSDVNQSPYYAPLHDLMSSNNGMGALSAYSQLRTPMMGSIGASYNKALQSAGEGAMRKFAQEGGLNDSPWDWLFGRGNRNYNWTAGSTAF